MEIEWGKTSSNLIGIDETHPFEIAGQYFRGKCRLSRPVRASDEDQVGHGAVGSDIDLALEDEIRGAGQGDISEGLIAGFLEADDQSVATFDIDLDRARRAGEEMMDEGGGDHAGAAGEGLILHAALEGADGNVVGREHGGEVGVGASGGEGGVITDRAAVGEDVEFIERLGIGEETDHMRDAGVDEMQRRVEAGDGRIRVQLEAGGLGHGDADIVADHLCGERADDGFRRSRT